MGEVGGVDFTDWGFQGMEGVLEGGNEGLIREGTHFLQVYGVFRGGIFGCREALPLSKRRVV